MPPSRAPLVIAIVVLLLPALYFVSYLALVVPRGMLVVTIKMQGTNRISTGSRIHYLQGGRAAEIIFLPLEQVDRKIRPDAWSD